jgi:predicted DNA-binding transcriptional regulator AlpA
MTTTPIKAQKLDISQQLTCTPAQAMSALGIGKTSLYELINAGTFRSFTYGKARLLVVSSIVKWIEDMSYQSQQEGN